MTTETAAFVSIFTGNITLILLVVALGIFGWLTARAKDIKGFQFQIFLFIVIWIVGEIADLMQEQMSGWIPLFSHYHEIGMYIHVLAMALLSAMLWTRFYLSRRSGKMIEDDSLHDGEE
ncbi:hypothetical protein NTE_00719 [Candidatus Nitrososphaera evergladensis SR1]|uniref:Uncharacterized protein n=1 Tax=Candidatus Nitrososphaera evergladensis SR1 TaxID=1459636 RepID=A0A075MU31_9ARCH|nr:hypothetical protein [Candidatus Nitrososphaera evergladensis]AIF82799.1 hypothetical protein NTE_00719 [Candidatus Nitrososphaera evergladensis SR1]